MRSLGFVVMLAGATVALTGCPPPYPKCETDANCTEKGEVCVQGMCKECATDANCKPGFVCDANRCVPKPECTPDTRCPGNKKCQAGKCVEVKEEGACTTNTDCPAGQECQNGRCATPVVQKTSCTFEAVHFDFNDFNLTSSATKALNDYADCIKRDGLRFTLEGHADERGTEEYNMVLSQKRAASVRKYLVDLGVAGGALETVGYGELKPAVNGSNEEAWSANRRVEFKKR